MRLWVGIAALGCVVLVVLISLIVPIKIGRNYLLLKAYFVDTQDLRPGARVRLGGIDVGVVTRIRDTRDLSTGFAPMPATEGTIEVTMAIRTVNRATVPSDAVASLARSGMLGQTFVEIDVSKTNGAPVQSGAVLKTQVRERAPW
ncbi:MAG: MlaD family protein [Terriglobales bacterium]